MFQGTFCSGTVYVRRARTNRIFPIHFQRNSTNYHTPTESKVSSKSIKYFQFEYKMNDLQISCSLSGIQFGPVIAGFQGMASWWAGGWMRSRADTHTHAHTFTHSHIFAFPFASISSSVGCFVIYFGFFNAYIHFSFD